MKRVAVLRGGPSSEYDVSMLTGTAVLKALTNSGYDCTDVVITKSGDWLESGRTRKPEQVLLGVDVVFIALHGTYGEDGQVQRLLENFGVPFTGSNSFPSAIAFNKIQTKNRVCQHGVCTPVSRRLRKHELKDPRTITRIERDLGAELFAKPPASGSSDGARRITQEDDTHAVLDAMFDDYDELLLEEFVEGTEVTVGVLEDFRGESLYSMPVVEIIPPKEAGFYDRAVKYNGDTKHITPANIPKSIRDELQRLARLVHIELGCKQYSRSDFLIKEGKCYFLEINTLPGFTAESNYPIAADAIGLSFNDLVKHLVETARV